MQFGSLTLPYSASAILLFVFFITLLAKAQKTPKVVYFIISLFFLWEWTTSEVILTFASDELQKRLGYCMTNLGICFFPSFLMLFAVCYAIKRPPAALIIALLAVSSFFYGAVLTNSSHMLYYTSFSLYDVERGPLFWCRTAFSYASLLVFMVLVIYRRFKDKTSSKTEYTLLICAMVIPLVTNILYLATPISKGADITTISLSATVILLLFACYNTDFLDINAVALDSIPDALELGIVIYNRRGRITYANDIFYSMSAKAKLPQKDLSADMLCDIIMKSNPDTDIMKNSIDHASIKLDDMCFQLTSIEIISKIGGHAATMLIFSDVTAATRKVERLQASAHQTETSDSPQSIRRLFAKLESPALSTLSEMKTVLRHVRYEYKENRVTDIETHLDDLIEANEICIDSVRDILSAASSIGTTPLIMCIKQMVSEQHGIEVILDIDGSDRDEFIPLSENITGICRGIISTAIRYSAAAAIRLSLNLKPDSIVIDTEFICSKEEYDTVIHEIGTLSDKLDELNGVSSLSYDNSGNFTVNITIHVN